MKANEIKVGGYYKAKVSGVLVTVRVDEIRKVRAYKSGELGEKTVYDVTNTETGKKTLFHSAAKFRSVDLSKETITPEMAKELLTPMPQEARMAYLAKVTEGEDSSDPRSGGGVMTQSTSASATSGKQPTNVISPRLDGQPSEPKSETGSATAPSVKSSGNTENSLAAKLGSLYATSELTEMVAGMTPTEEQRAVLEAARQQGLRTLVIGAGAGTGKTATLKMLEQVLPGSGQYTAFNSNLVAESKAKFRKAQCQPDGTLIRVPLSRSGLNRVLGWREVPIETLKDGDLVISWKGMNDDEIDTGKGKQQMIRKRGKPIKVSKRHYTGNLITIVVDNSVSSYTPEHPCIAVIGDAFDGKHLVYLMKRGEHYKIGLCSGRINSRRNSNKTKASGLRVRAQMEGADAIWVLRTFDDRDEAALYEAMCQYNYNIPGWTFQPSLRLPSQGGNRVRRVEIGLHRLWSRVPSNEVQARICLTAHDKDIEMPLWTRESNVYFDRSPAIVNAINIIPGMRVLTADSCGVVKSDGIIRLSTPKKMWRKITDVGLTEYDGNVTSLEVEYDHTYFADGILTHNCNTTHSLAFRAVGRNYSHRLGGQRVRSDQIAATLGIGAITVANGTKPDGTPTTKVLQPGFLAGQVMVAIRSFCQSADRYVSTRHFRYIDGIDQPTEDGRRGRVNNEMVKEYLLPFAERAWEDLRRVDGNLPYTHDHYVKIWQLGEGKDRPVISADYILLDESQDTAPVMLDILKQQTHSLLILVGDSNQCQPSGTKVKVVKAYRRGNRFTGCLPTIYKDTPIEAIRVGDIVASYDVSRSFFRRTGSRVLEIAERPFDGEVVTVSVETKETSSFTPDHRCVVRIGDAFNNKWLVYLMKKGESFRVGMVKGMYETQLGDLGLPMRMRAEEAEAGWVLSVCDSEDQARLEEACISWSWGIPSLRFLQGMGRGISQASLNEFWSTMGDLSDKVAGLLTACGRDIRYPLCTNVTSIYRNRGCLVQACNLVDGMLMLTMEGALASDGKRAAKNRWSKITVARQHYEGMVHSLRVSDDETYVSDGIITHNSIYEWRGAVDAMKAFPGAPRRLLSQSFRFGQVIADMANSVLADLDEPTDLVMKGLPSIPSRVDVLPEPRCILCRTNATAVSTLLGAKASGKRPFLIGGSAEVVKFVKAAADLQRNVRTQHPELCCFESWKEVQEYVATDEGEDLKLMTKLIDEFQCAPILDALENMPTESEADMVVSTAHRSKGREWDTVKLAGDFPTANRMSDSDRRLLYVAVTRAKLILDISQCPPFHDGKDKVTGETVTGLKIRYTVPMPTKEQGEVYLAEKTAPRPTPLAPITYEQARVAVDAGYGASPDVHGSDNPPSEGWKPASTSQPPTNGSFNKEGFTWTNWDGVWSVRGPKGQEGKTVTVTRKDGTTSPRKLLGVIKDFGDNCVYRV